MRLFLVVFVVVNIHISYVCLFSFELMGVMVIQSADVMMKER